jgi:hypothetical protein
VSVLQPMVQQPVPSGPQGMMVAPVGRPGAGGPQQPGSGPMNPNQPGQSMCSFNLKLLLFLDTVKSFSSATCFAWRAPAVNIGIPIMFSVSHENSWHVE